MTSSSFPFPVPLAYDTLYYVESPNNEPLNQAMRQIAAAGQPLFANPEMQPFPLRLQCLTQDELAADRLSARLIGDFDPDLVAETISDLRECLHADTGGTLTARCLPKFTGDVRVDDRAVCILEDFGKTSPEDALANAKTFARTVAEENFERLSGETFYSFQRAKVEYSRPPRHSGGGMGFTVVPPDPKEIVQKIQKRLAKINDTIDENTNAYDIIRLLEADLKKLKDKGKQKTMYPIVVKQKDIYLQISETELLKTDFGRGEVAKTLYIFYLQQIARAADSHSKPIYISKQELADHKEELYDIYWSLGGGSIKKANDINIWWDGPYGDFDNALSHIRKFFKKEFDVDYLLKKFKKRYSIEILEKGKNEKGCYGIALDPSDIIWESHKYR